MQEGEGTLDMSNTLQPQKKKRGISFDNGQGGSQTAVDEVEKPPKMTKTLERAHADEENAEASAWKAAEPRRKHSPQTGECCWCPV